MTIIIKFFLLFDIFILNLLISMIIGIKPIYSSNTSIGDSIKSTTNITVFNSVEPSTAPTITHHQYSDLENIRKLSRFNEMYNDFPRISYDTIHQILRDEDSSDSSYHRNVKQNEQQLEKSTISTVDSTISTVDDNVGHKISSQKKISNTRIKRNSIADNLDLTAELIEINKWNSNKSNNSSDKFINNNIINSTKVLDLTNINLTTISELETLTIHSDIIQILNLTNNKLLEFNLNNIINLKQLKILDLTRNHLNEFILSNNQLKSIQVLNLTGNRVTKFSTINQLPINNNNIKPIIFQLKELSLRNNCIKSINSINLTMLNDLEILDLSYNQIFKLDQQFLEQIKNIKYLNLGKNRLGNEDDIVLTHVQNNSIVNHNENIERSSALSSNKNFNTTSNVKSKIFKEPFYNLLNIDTLILSYNNIRFIDFDTFMALPSLQYLDLSHNMIQGESIKSLQGIPDLVGLSIAYNPDLGDSLQEFVASWSLKELDISGTGLCRIPAALAQSVRTLKLVDNWLSIIRCGDLDSYPLLQYLDLSHTHIDEIEDDALGRLEILETLFLDHNNLKHIPVSLPTSLENLFLHQNQITDILPQIFQGLHNLKTLDLSHNKLLYLPGLPLPKLLTLNLQSSELKRLSQSVVKTSPKLRNLLLDNNPIKCSDLLGIAEWTSSCYGENYESNRNTTPKNIKKYFQQKFNYFPNFEQSENNFKIKYDCFANIETAKVNKKNIKQIIPKCALIAANLKDKHLKLNETTNNCDEKLDNFKDKLLNLSTNSKFRHRPTNRTENVGHYEEKHKKITPNEVGITELNFTSTIVPDNSTVYSSYVVYDNTQEKNPIIIKENKENLTLSKTTTGNKFLEKNRNFSLLNNLNEINEKKDINNVIPTVKSFTNISENSAELMRTANPAIEQVFKRDKQFNIYKENNLQEIEINAKILPILSLSLNNSTDIIEEKKSNDIKNNTKKVLKQIHDSKQVSSNIGIEREQNNFMLISDNNNVRETTSVLLDHKDNIQQQEHNFNNNEKFRKTTNNNLTTTVSKMRKNFIKNENILLNKTANRNNNKSTENILNGKYLQGNITSKNSRKMNETNINKSFEKNNNRRLYASGTQSKDKQQHSTPIPIITNPLNHSLLSSLSRVNLNNNMENRLLAPFYNSKDKKNENTKKNLQQEKFLLDEINRSEIKRHKIYKNNQMKQDKISDIKKSFIQLTTSATTFINWSIVDDKNHTILPKNTDSPPTINLPSIKLKNKQNSTKFNKADHAIFYNSGQNNVNTITNLDGGVNENVIIKENQKNSSTIFMDQLGQKKLYDKKFLTTISKSKVTPPQPQHQVDQNPPILLHGNLLYKQKKPTENLILNERLSKQNHSIVKDLKETFKSSTEELIQSSNHKLQRNLKNSNLNTSENIMFHKNIILDKNQEFGINKTFYIIGKNNDTETNNRKLSKIKIENDHNEGSSININGSSKMVDIFTELNKRDNINSDILANKNLDNNIRLTEIENLMSDQKNELTNDNINNLFKSSQSNAYHHYSNDDNDSKNIKENLKNSFNEFKKDTTEFIKLEHQHLGNVNLLTRPQQELSLEATIQDDNIKLKSPQIDNLLVKSFFSKNSNTKIDDETLTTSSYHNNNEFENHLKVNTENFQEHSQNNSLVKNLQIINNHNKSNNNINSISSNNNSSKIVSALGEMQFQRSKDNNNVSKINILKNNNHKIIENNSKNIDNSENSNGLTPEQWLEIRLNNQTTIGHPGLFIVIGITFSLIFLLGIIHIYRCHRRPWYYSHHHNLNDRNYGSSKYHNRACRKHQQSHLNSSGHGKCTCNNIIFQSSDQQQNCIANEDERYCCQCNDDDINNFYIEMSDQDLGKSLSAQASSIPHHRKNIFPMEILRLPTQTTTISTLSSKIDNNDDDDVDDSSLKTSHSDGFSAGGKDWTTNPRKQW